MEADELAGRIVQRSPQERFRELLVEQFDENIVSFVERLFYLRSWKNLHGSYPYEPLPHETMKALLAIETELKLRESKEVFDSKQKSQKMDSQIRAQAAKARGGGMPGVGGGGQTF